MLNYGDFLRPKTDRPPPFRLPFMCGPTQAKLLQERQFQRDSTNVVYRPHNPNLIR